MELADRLANVFIGMDHRIDISYLHRIRFTFDVFHEANLVLADLVRSISAEKRVKLLAFVDEAVVEMNPGVLIGLCRYVIQHSNLMEFAGEPVVLPGGESCKNDFQNVEQCWTAIHRAALDRHSLVLAIGGGAVLDLVGFAAATAHRGIRLIRLPTTTLSQGDGGVGVKNGVNFFGKKNWVGTFNVPFAVVNDFQFLETLPPRVHRDGLIEAVKVAMIRDAVFFQWLEGHADELAQLHKAAVEEAVQRSAELHIEHIATGGDPFELGSARPLDFGHWAAHRLEALSDFSVSHGEAVAIGMALDITYSMEKHIMSEADGSRALDLIEKLGFPTFSSHLLACEPEGKSKILTGLEEFREHLGGELTITLVPCIGEKMEVHEMDPQVVLWAARQLEMRADNRS